MKLNQADLNKLVQDINTYVDACADATWAYTVYVETGVYATRIEEELDLAKAALYNTLHELSEDKAQAPKLSRGDYDATQARTS